MTNVILASPDGKQRVTVPIEGIAPHQYQRVSDYLGEQLKRTSQTYIGVAEAMLLALKLCPKANPSDLWVHLIYHQFRNRFDKNDPSWKRVSGQALEFVVIESYRSRLHTHGISIRGSKPADAKTLGLVDLGFGSAKTDIVLEGVHRNKPHIFGVLHCKASIGERLSDDAPASKALIDAGYWSAVVTIDAKMFPPPHGDGVVRGEFGHTKGGDKRRYTEVAGLFSGCFSFNLRTPPSEGKTKSGGRIWALGFSETQPDALVREILNARNTHKPRITGKTP